MKMTSVFTATGLNSVQSYLQELKHFASHDEDTYLKLEEEIEKYIDSNFICAKVENISIYSL